MKKSLRRTSVLTVGALLLGVSSVTTQPSPAHAAIGTRYVSSSAISLTALTAADADAAYNAALNAADAAFSAGHTTNNAALYGAAGAYATAEQVYQAALAAASAAYWADTSSSAWVRLNNANMAALDARTAANAAAFSAWLSTYSALNAALNAAYAAARAAYNAALAALAKPTPPVTTPVTVPVTPPVTTPVTVPVTPPVTTPSSSPTTITLPSSSGSNTPRNTTTTAVAQIDDGTEDEDFADLWIKKSGSTFIIAVASSFDETKMKIIARAKGKKTISWTITTGSGGAKRFATTRNLSRYLLTLWIDGDLWDSVTVK